MKVWYLIRKTDTSDITKNKKGVEAGNVSAIVKERFKNINDHFAVYGNGRAEIFSDNKS